MLKCDFNKVTSNFIEITLCHGCSPVNLLHIFRTPLPNNDSYERHNLSVKLVFFRYVVIKMWQKIIP